MYRQIPALTTWESGPSTTMVTTLCPWVVDRLLHLWLLITAMQPCRGTAGLHEVISLVFLKALQNWASYTLYHQVNVLSPFNSRYKYLGMLCHSQGRGLTPAIKRDRFTSPS